MLMLLAPGARLGPYEIVALAGSGDGGKRTAPGIHAFRATSRSR